MKYVLLIEDDSAVSDATRMMLETCGYDVRVAEDGSGALAFVTAGFRPDLIVADYRLPRQNGVDVVRAIRAAAAAELPAIIVTGDTSARLIESAGLANLQVMRKPMDADDFIDRIAQWSRIGGWRTLSG